MKDLPEVTPLPLRPSCFGRENCEFCSMFVKQDHSCETKNATFIIVYSKPVKPEEAIILKKNNVWSHWYLLWGSWRKDWSLAILPSILHWNRKGYGNRANKILQENKFWCEELSRDRESRANLFTTFRNTTLARPLILNCEIPTDTDDFRCYYTWLRIEKKKVFERNEELEKAFEEVEHHCLDQFLSCAGIQS